MSEEKDKSKAPEYKDIFNLRILGFNFGDLLQNWLGVTDLDILKDPEKMEAVKKRIETRRAELREAQEKLRRKFGDAVRFDYDIRVKSLLGEKDEIRVGGGSFFDALDKLVREGSQKTQPAPYAKREGVRQPVTEVIEGNEYLEIIAEMPGVEEKNIEIKVQDEKISISTIGSERAYQVEVPLPSKVLDEPVESSYHNGVLKIRLKKEETSGTKSST